ncbi:unnamed protein product, partial [Brassica oleracea var. botrytis]
MYTTWKRILCEMEKPPVPIRNQRKLKKTRRDLQNQRRIKEALKIRNQNLEMKSKRRRDLNGRWKLLKLGKKISHLIKNHELKEGNPLGCLIFFL